VELEGITGKFDGGLDGETVGAGDLEAELSRIALRQKRKSDEENYEVEQ